MFENRALRIFGLKREEVTEENYILRTFIICALHKILIG
jgi:hypothetical protein